MAYVLTIGLGGCAVSPTYRERAFDPTTHDVSGYIEALTWMGIRSSPPRRECFYELVRDLEPLFGVHCARADRSVAPPAPHAPCPQLRGYLMDVARLRLRDCVSADTKATLPDEYYAACGSIAVEASRTYCIASSEELCDELIDGAARTFVMAHLQTKALALWSRLRTSTWIEASRERRELVERLVREEHP